jgi:hypothetical protein
MARQDIAFLLGFIFAFVVLAILLKTPKRLRRAARVLVAIAESLEGQRTGASAACGGVSISAQQSPAASDSIEADVLGALLNFESKKSRTRARKHQLAEIVRSVVAEKPGADFETTFRAALKLATA